MTVALPREAVPSSFLAVRPLPFLCTVLVGVLLWFLPHPEGLDIRAWHMLAIFVATIVGAITSPLPLAPTVLAGMVVAICTGAASFQSMFLSFSEPTVWLVCMAFFLASGLIRCGLAKRAAYLCVSRIGHSTLGLVYGLVFGEAFLAPFIPSIAARSGGIFFPIVSALADEYDDGVAGSPGRRTARFLITAVFQGSVICSGMFMTSMAANPLMAQMASQIGVNITWGGWALATLVPGAVAFLVIPFVVYCVSRPGHSKTPEAPLRAREALAEMGPISSSEWRMIVVFAVVLCLWLFGPAYGVNSTVAAMVGILLMIAFDLLSWEGCLGEKKAWDTLLWLGGFVAMGGELKELGIFTWFGGEVGGALTGMRWELAFPLLCAVYFYSHYLFASATAHVVGMYFVCLVTAVEVGTPPMMAAMALALVSNLYGGITHYGNASAPLYFGSGYSSLSHWWKVGFVTSLANFLVWGIVGMAWWKVIGLW